MAMAAGGAVYWFREALGEKLVASGDSVITYLGLGVAPAGLWLAVFLGALASRRWEARRGHVWLGSLGLVALSLGIMAFFEIMQGPLARFTNYGDVALGGKAGNAIVGSATWVGALRLIGVAVASVAVMAPSLPAAMGAGLGRLAVDAYIIAVAAAPPLARAGSARLAKLAMYVYLVAFVVLKGIAPILPLMRVARSKRKLTSPVNESSSFNTMGGGVRLPHSLAVRSQASNVTAVGSKVPSDVAPPRIQNSSPIPPPSFVMPTATVPEAQAEVGRGELGTQQSKVEVLDDMVEEAVGDDDGPSAVARGKFNKLWAAFEPGDDQLVQEPEVLTPDNGSQTGDRSWPNAVAENTMGAWAQDWTPPSTELLVDGLENSVTEEELRDTAETIQRTLAQYGVEVDIGQISPGPTVTMYGLVPGWVRRYRQEKQTDEDGRPVLDQLGKPVTTRVETKTRVKVDAILSREKDLALALKTPSIRIETPAMGQSLVGLEVPNPNPSLVTLRSVMESGEFSRLRTKASLPVALGKGSGGETVVIDLAKMPHLLIAGATGSGKSACINAILSCLIMERSPEQVRLLLIDPKRVELTSYNGIPHLLTPVVVETDQVVALLKGMIHEMLDRYRRMEEVGVRNVEAYNARARDKMPLLVVAIDELADLMMSAAFDVEQSLCRLAQLGRATGIHLIVATQRPSVDVVTGLIKANFPSRISFAVTSYVDSRTILDTTGAEKLLGRGDMLYQPLDASKPVRVQGVFISDHEIENVVNYWQTTPWAQLSNISLRAVEKGRSDDNEEARDRHMADEYLDKAIQLAHSYSKLSTSLLQRRLRIGYPRAARLIDQLEEQGVVGPSDGSKSRDVIIGAT